MTRNKTGLYDKLVSSASKSVSSNEDPSQMICPNMTFMQELLEEEGLSDDGEDSGEDEGGDSMKSEQTKKILRGTFKTISRYVLSC